LFQQVSIRVLQLGILHDDVGNLAFFEHNLLLIQLGLDLSIASTQVHQQLFIGGNALLCQLQQVLLAFEGLFELVDFVFVNFGDVILFVCSVSNYLLLHELLSQEMVPLLGQRLDSRLPELILLGHLGECVLELSVEFPVSH